MGRLSKEEKARRTAQKAELEKALIEMEESRKRAEEVTKPHLDAINNILDNIEGLGKYSSTWNGSFTSNGVMGKNTIRLCSADFGGCGRMNMERYFRISVVFDHDTQKFNFNVSQCRMGGLNEEELEDLIEQTNSIKTVMANIKAATDKVLDYAKVNGIELY